MCILYPTLNGCPAGTPTGTAPTGTNETNDTDGDGIPDYLEVLNGTNPLDPNDPVIGGLTGT